MAVRTGGSFTEVTVTGTEPVACAPIGSFTTKVTVSGPPCQSGGAVSTAVRASESTRTITCAPPFAVHKSASFG